MHKHSFGFGIVFFILSALSGILIPLSLAILFSILLNPLVSRFEKWKIPRMLSIVLAMLITLLVFSGVGYFFTSQIVSFGKDLPTIKKKFTDIFSHGQTFLHDHLGISLQQQNKWVVEARTDIKPVIGRLMGSMLGAFAGSILLPIYTFLVLYYKKLILNFIYEIFAEGNSGNVGVILDKTKKAIQNYMVGLVIEGIIVGTLNSLALLIIGIKYAFLLGVIGAFVNVLPFIGGILAIIFPIAMAAITKDGFQAQLFVILSFTLIQFVGNHFLIPFVVSSKVKINALLSIIVVLLGGALWGIVGMFLAIPVVGILKIIFDRIDELNPYGKLLGFEMPVYYKRQILKKRIKKFVA